MQLKQKGDPKAAAIMPKLAGGRAVELFRPKLKGQS
jgi:hypothetical protein